MFQRKCCVQNNDDGTICEHGTKIFPVKWTMKAMAYEWFLPCSKVWLHDCERKCIWAHMSMWCKLLLNDCKWEMNESTHVYVMQTNEIWNEKQLCIEWWHTCLCDAKKSVMSSYVMT